MSEFFHPRIAKPDELPAEWRIVPEQPAQQPAAPTSHSRPQLVVEERWTPRTREEVVRSLPILELDEWLPIEQEHEQRQEERAGRIVEEWRQSWEAQSELGRGTENLEQQYGIELNSSPPMLRQLVFEYIAISKIYPSKRETTLKQYQRYAALLELLMKKIELELVDWRPSERKAVLKLLPAPDDVALDRQHFKTPPGQITAEDWWMLTIGASDARVTYRQLIALGSDPLQLRTASQRDWYRQAETLVKQRVLYQARRLSDINTRASVLEHYLHDVGLMVSSAHATPLQAEASPSVPAEAQPNELETERDVLNILIEDVWDRKLEKEIVSLLYDAGMKGRTLYEAIFRRVPEKGEPVSREHVEQGIKERLWLLAQERFTRFGVREQFEILLPTYQLNEYSLGQIATVQDQAGLRFNPDGLYRQRDVLIEQLRRLTGEIAPNQGYVGVARLTCLVTAHPSRRFVRSEPNA